MTSFNSYDFNNWSPNEPLRGNSFSTQGSVISLPSLDQFPRPPSAATSPIQAEKGKEATANSDEYVRLELNPAVTVYVCPGVPLL